MSRDSRRTKHDRRNANQTFTCINCRRSIPTTSYGTKHRNHCPYCLYSRHLDNEPGDRRAACQAPMEPIALAVRGGGAGGEWTVIHRCTACATIKTNRIAGDDHELALLSLALRPLANPPFPLDCFGSYLSAPGSL